MPAAPSLLIVPYRSKTGKLYSQIPTSGAGDFTVTRNTEARRFTSAGLIASVASGIPRLDYYTSGGTAGCPALLVEPAATNLVPNGVGFNAATGVQTSGVTDSPAVAISGTLMTKNEASGTIRYGSQTFSASALASGTTYSVSRFFKYNGVAFNTSLEASSATQWGNVGWKQVVVFSAASGVTLGASTACTGSVENFGNGWYRVNARVTTGATIGGVATVNVLSELPAALSTGQGFLTACPQLETGSVATSYIPTTAGTGSRSGDLVSATGAVSGSIGQTAGTFYLDLTYSLRLTSTATRWIQIFGSSNNIGLAVATTNIVRSIVNGQSDILSTPSTADGVKIAWGYDGSGVVCFVNGTQYTLTNGGAQIITQLNQISLDLSTTNAIGNCRLRAMALYTTRLTNAELAALTA